MNHLISLCRSPLAALGAALILTACAQTSPISPTAEKGSAAGATAATSFTQFPDVPIPSGAKINVDKTLVFGSDPWFGQLTLNTSGGADQMFQFYRSNLGGYGWREITSVRAPTSILTYDNDDRVLAIAIRAATLLGAEVTITVSPRGAPASGAPAGGVLPPPVQKLN